MSRDGDVSLSVRRFSCDTNLLLPFLHFFPLPLPAVVFGAHRRGNVSGVGLDLLSVGFFIAEVVAPLEVLLALQEALALLFRVLHVVLDHLVVRWDPERGKQIHG